MKKSIDFFKTLVAAQLAVLLFFTLPAFSAPVSFETAQSVAQKHLERTRGGKIKSAKFAHKPQLKKIASVAPYFIVEKENDGFIIVSGNDIATPILGEIDNGNFDEENMPPALLWFLETYEKQIAEAVKNGATQDNETKELWQQVMQSQEMQSSIPDTEKSYPTKLLSTTWDQRAPYNLQCPLDGATRSMTGCVATVMAQIMKYWQHPTHGTGASKAYETKTKKISVPSVNFNTDYDYANMLNSYTNSGNTAQRDAVSKLMYHCGASVKMDYAYSGSGAYLYNVVTALTQYFDYDNSIRHINSQISNISASDWKELVIGQVENNSPVFYGGVDASTGGHAFIIDGYKDDKFHINWGWSGLYDGFFSLTALNPNKYNFNDQQAMLINVMPNKGNSPPSQIKVSNFDISTTETAVNANIRAKMNYGTDFSGKIGFAIIAGDTVSMVLDSANYSISNNIYNPTTGRYAVNYKNAQLTKQLLGIPSGILTLQVVTKRGTGTWTPVGETRLIFMLTLYTITYNLNGGTILSENPTSYDIETPDFTLNNPVKAGYTFVGWTESNSTSLDTIVTIAQGSTGNREYTAHWTLNTYTVTFIDHDGTQLSQQTIDHGNMAIAPSEPIRMGYVFTGWDKDFKAVTEDLTVTALYEIDTPILPQIATNHSITQTRNGLNLTANANTTIEIYNLSGKLMSKQTYIAGNHSISFGHLPRGMYIAKASFGSEKQILRVPVM